MEHTNIISEGLEAIMAFLAIIMPVSVMWEMSRKKSKEYSEFIPHLALAVVLAILSK